jgi:hypothetical protein
MFVRGGASGRQRLSWAASPSFGVPAHDACVGAIYVSDEFWLQRVLHQHADWILAHETFEIGDTPYLEGCVHNVLTSPDTPQFAKFQTRSGRMSSIAVLTTHSAPDPEQVRTDAPADNG